MGKRAFAIAVLVAVLVLPGTAQARTEVFRADMSGDQESPPNTSDATGTAVYRLSRDGSTIFYRVVVRSIENVFAAHIHNGPAGVNGPICVTLYGGPLIPGEFTGTLAEGSFAVSDVNAANCPDFLTLLRSGNTYTNVHTDDPNRTTGGPGDLPGGEIRAQNLPQG